MDVQFDRCTKASSIKKQERSTQKHAAVLQSQERKLKTLKIRDIDTSKSEIWKLKGLTISAIDSKSDIHAFIADDVDGERYQE